MQNRPVPVVVCLSGGGSSFRHLYENDPNCGRLYRFVGVFSDVPSASGLVYAQNAGIPTTSLDFEAWRGYHGVAKKDLAARVRYFTQALVLLERFDPKPEVIMLSGFMLRITEPWLSRFPGRILNVHPALLSILDENGKRAYTGLRVVERAMKAGDPTGTTVHIVTDEPDTGSIITESIYLPYDQTTDPAAHQDEMKIQCDGPAYQRALEKLIMMHGWPRKPWPGRAGDR